MSEYRVRLTKRAVGHFDRIGAWWRANRQAAPDLFEEEIATAFETLAQTPRAGLEYKTPKGAPTVRRLLLFGTGYFLYYDLDEGSRVALILAIWHSSRGRRPPLPRP